MTNLLDGNKLFIYSTTSGIGDMIMAIPMLKLLNRKMPEADITLCVLAEGTRQLFETCPFIKRVIKIEAGGLDTVRKNLRLLSNIRHSYDFDLCMATCDSSGYFSQGLDSIVSRLIRAKRRIGFSLPNNDFFRFKYQLPQLLMDETVTIDFFKHYVIHNIELLKFLGIYPDDGIPAMELWLTEEDDAATDSFLMEHSIESSDMIVGIHPGGQLNRRRWSKENFAALIDSLYYEYSNAKILIFGGPDEEDLKRYVAGLVKTTKPIIVTTMPLRKTSALIKRCKVFIGSDSSLTHISAAVGTPAVVIYGPANPRATGPYSDKSVVVTCQLGCQPCTYNKVSFQTELAFALNTNCWQTPRYACLKQLTVSKVLNSVNSLSKYFLS